MGWININIRKMNRQSWTCQEDEAISRLVGEYGFNDWTQIALKLKEHYNISKRTGKQCRQRWYNHLNPAVNKKPWGNQEEELLFQLHKQHGNRWKDISRFFQGRTDNDIKNHFYSTLRRSLRRLNKILGQKNSTSQMRQIKPSVLSTIMHYLYEQDHGDDDLYRSLKDLPSLIFQFANFKPIKTNLALAKVEDAKTKISDIFALIGRFNEDYETNKALRLSKNKKSSPTMPPTPDPKVENPTQKTEGQIKNQESSCSNSKPFHPEDYLLKEEDHDFGIRHFPHHHQQCQQGEPEDYSAAIKMLIEDEIALEELKDPEQPSLLSKQGDGLDLTVVGHHWQPQSWERQANAKEFMDQILQMNYEQARRG